MSKGKDSVAKINDEIEKIISEEFTTVLEDGEKTADTISNDGTKKIDRIESIVEDDISSGDTKKIDSIENITSEVFDNGEEVKSIEYLDSLVNDTDISKDKIDSDELDKNINKRKKIILIIVVFLILVVFFCLFTINKRDKVDAEIEKKLSKSEQKEIINNYGEALEEILAVYYQKQNVLLEYKDAVKLVDLDDEVDCEEHEIYEDGSVYLNECSINDEETVYSYGKKQEKKDEPTVTEGDIKVYVNKTSKEATLNLPKYLENYDIYSFNIEEAYSDLTLLSKSKGSYVFYYDNDYNVQMIDFKTGNKILEHVNYKSVLPIKRDDDSYDVDRVAVNINGKWGIYNLTTGGCIIYPKYDNVAFNLNMGVTGPSLCANVLDDNKLVVVYNGAVGVIDYTNDREIIPIIYNGILKSGDYLWATDSKNRGHILDYNGKEYLNGAYNRVYGFVDGRFVLVNDKEDIRLVGVDGQEIYNYGDVKLGEYNFGLGYNNGAVFQFYKPGGGYSECLEIMYNPSEKKGEVKDSSCGGVAKPVLYLYPKKKTKIKISFEHPEYLETTYPKFNGTWEVTANSNGDLRDKNDKYYYGLYWDEKKVHNVDFSTGYYVEDKKAIDFLEGKLEYLGFNEREANEFIMYWLPILEKNKRSLVYFELTEERESYNKIKISPRPDSLLRLVIHIKKVEKEIEIPKQNLTRFKRKGFVVVEWGGTTY